VSRSAEAALILAASALAAFGVSLVNFSDGGTIDAQSALTFLVFVPAFGALLTAIRAWAPFAVPFLVPLAATISAVGFVTVYRLDRDLADLQRRWLLLGSGLAILALYLMRSNGVDPLRRYRYLFLAAAVALFLLPLLPSSGPLPLTGLEVNGSLLWVRLDAGVRIQFQPGEIAKLLLVVFLASFLAERQTALSVSNRRIGRFTVPEPRQLTPVLIAWIASLAVLVYQRDLGASLLLFGVFIVMLYMATNRAAYLGTGLVMFGAGVVLAYTQFAHVQRRVSAWLDPWSDYEGVGYQIAQGMFAMGSGSLSGSGLGLGRPDLIPAAATDFVFAVVAEEMGLSGSIVVIAAYSLLVATGFGIAVRSRDLFRKLLAAGLSFVLGLQTILILAGVMRLMPVTGITLPFMSYGGSSLLANFLLIALLARISHEERT
jgi:cell division protein FtsW (lipid II flippase)